MTDCLNDCRDPIAFPRRVFNRAGLERLRYRIGDYAEIRDTLMRWLDLEPGLTGWTHRDPAGDPGIALLEGAAIVGDILTFYQEHYANEAFLRTATWRESVADLVRLVGYRLAPGVGGRATFAFEVRGGRPVLVSAGFRLSADVTGIEGQSDFETVDAIEAIASISRFALYRRSHVGTIVSGTSRFSADTPTLAVAGVTISPGDRLMIVVDPAVSTSLRQIVVVEAVRQAFDRTEITIRGSWRGTTAFSAGTAYKLGRSFRYFGHNSPSPAPQVSGTGAVTYANVDFLLTPGSTLFLDQALDDLSSGSIMLATLPLSPSRVPPPAGAHFFAKRIQGARIASRAHGVITGAATVVQLDGPLGFVGMAMTDIRELEAYEVIGESFTMTAALGPHPDTDPARLVFFGPLEAYRALDHRRVQLARGDEVEETVLTIDPAETLAGDRRRPVTLNPPLRTFTLADFPLDPLPEAARVYAYGNIVDATQGHSEREAVLGNGDNRAAFQTFKLPKAPLTYHVSAGAAPPEVPELEIFVGNRRWKRVPSFFNRGPTEEIYVVREDPDGASWVQFGDDRTGARLPSGIGNVRARYRTGIGANGPLRDGTSVQPGGRLDRLDRIRLLGVASGGDQPESLHNAREAAPGKVTSLGRLVSVADHEAETLAIAGVWRASARWALVSNVPAIVLTILMKTGRDAEMAAVRRVIAEQSRCRGAQRFPIVVEAGALEYLYLDAIVAIDPALEQGAVIAAIRAALGVVEPGSGETEGRGLLATVARRFGEREYATRIEGTIQNVPGVMWARVDGLGTVGSGDPAALATPPAPWPFDDVVNCANDRILALHSLHFNLRTALAAARPCA